MSLRKRGYLGEEFNKVRAGNLFTNALAKGGYSGLFIVRSDRKNPGVSRVLNVSATKAYAAFEFQGDEDKIKVVVDPDNIFKSKKDHGVVSKKKAVEVIQKAISSHGRSAPAVFYGRRY